MERGVKLTPAQQELLVCLMEECGEVIQATSKILRHGTESPPYDNYSDLMHEIGNILAVLAHLVLGDDFLDEDLIDCGINDKCINLNKYLHGELLG